MFKISGTSDRLWNQTEFVKYLADHQNQDIELDLCPEAVCLENLGVYRLLDCFKFKSVTIRTWNPLEKHPRYQIKFKASNFWFKRIYSIDPALQTWDLTKKFFCLYHRPTAARLGLASYLDLHYPDQSLIHFSIDAADDNKDQFEFDKLFDYDANSVAPAGNLIKKLPLLLHSKQGYTAVNGYDYSDKLTGFYQNILVDVVVESHVAGNTFFPTEKTIRPMLLKKPFVVFGSRDYLLYLRGMGFRTFADFWNEDYDGFERGARLLKIYQLLDFIAGLSAGQLEKMYWDMQYTLDHNYNLLMSQTYQQP